MLRSSPRESLHVVSMISPKSSSAQVLNAFHFVGAPAFMSCIRAMFIFPEFPIAPCILSLTVWANCAAFILSSLFSSGIFLLISLSAFLEASQAFFASLTALSNPGSLSWSSSAGLAIANAASTIAPLTSPSIHAGRYCPAK